MIVPPKTLDIMQLNARDLARGYCIDDPRMTLTRLQALVERYLSEHWDLDQHAYEWHFEWDNHLNYPTAVVIRPRSAVEQLGDLA